MKSTIEIISLTVCCAFAGLLVMLCLGAQNGRDRQEIRLGAIRSVPLPSGFLVGMSLVVGVISGGCACAVLMPDQRSD